MSKRKSEEEKLKKMWSAALKADDGLSFPTLKKVTARTIASSLVSVTPMATPSGKLFWADVDFDEVEVPLTAAEIEAQTITDIENKIKEEIGLPSYKIPESNEINKTSFDDLWEARPIITSTPLRAPVSKIKTKWTKSLVEDLSTMHSIDAVEELTKILQEEIMKMPEIKKEP